MWVTLLAESLELSAVGLRDFRFAVQHAINEVALVDDATGGGECAWTVRFAFSEGAQEGTAVWLQVLRAEKGSLVSQRGTDIEEKSGNHLI